MDNAAEVLGMLQRRGWTYAAIADDLGVHVKTVSRWAAGGHTPRNEAAVVDKLSRLLLTRPPRDRRHHIRRELLDGIYKSRTCLQCGETKPLERFTGANPVCRDCRRKR